MATKRVVVTDYNFGDMNIEEQAVATTGCTLVKNQCRTAAEVVKALHDADVAFVQMAPVTAEALEGLRPDAVLVRYGAGYDNIDIQACKRLGVTLAYVPDYGTEEVAVHSMAMLLMLLRKLPQLDASVRSGDWEAAKICGSQLAADEVTLGLYGVGMIGLAMAKRAVVFGMNCIAHDPYADVKVCQQANVKLVGLDELWARSDAISMHAPLTKETHNVLNSESFTKLKVGMLIVNCARGGLIEGQALAAALQSGQVAGAALDVFGTEPLPADDPLRTAPNLLLSPHAAWCSGRSMRRLRELAADEVVRAIKGESLRCPVPL